MSMTFNLTHYAMLARQARYLPLPSARPAANEPDSTPLLLGALRSVSPRTQR